jgi:serine/threonine protein kinase
MSSALLYCSNCGAVHRPQANFCVVCGQPLPTTSPAQQITPGHAGSSRAPGQHLLNQRYRILSRVGEGGMGAVYKAEDTLLGNRLMAVKEMHQAGLDLHELGEAIEAFKQEALLLAGLMHPNLPRIYDHFTDSGHWYLVMDFIAGETLEDHLHTAPGGHLPVQQVLNIGIQFCAVLDYLHTRQPPIIFRDLKPANIMLTTEGHIYLIDFGIARHFKPGKAKDTVVLGSPGYAAPEQYGKAQTNPGADIYSLGATLHQLLSGDNPTEDPFQFAPLHLGNDSGLPRLEALIMQMVQVNKDKRPTSMIAIKQELQAIKTQRLSGRMGVSTTQPVSPGATQPPKTREQLLTTGQAHYNAKRYRKALLAFDQAIQLAPRLAVAYVGRGKALHSLQRYQEALAAFDQAIQLNPNLPGAYHNKGLVLEHLGRTAEAQQAHAKARQLGHH